MYSFSENPWTDTGKRGKQTPPPRESQAVRILNIHLVVSGEAAHAHWPVHWQPPKAVVLLQLQCHKEFLGEAEVTAKG